MADPFQEVPFEMLDRVFAVFALRPDVVFQILTKRPERMREYLSDVGTRGRVARAMDAVRVPVFEGEEEKPIEGFPGYFVTNIGRVISRKRSGGEGRVLSLEAGEQGHLRATLYRPAKDFPVSDTQIRNILNGAQWATEPGVEWPLSNCWLGTSAETQEWADTRIPELLSSPAAVRFVSCEPLLGEVRLEVETKSGVIYALAGERSVYRGPDGDEEAGTPFANGARIDWVIVGGESGSGSRPCDLGWIRSIVGQCQAAGVAVFVKQDSGRKPGQQGRIPNELWIKEFPDAIR